jgi:hypothetical protein
LNAAPLWHGTSLYGAQDPDRWDDDLQPFGGLYATSRREVAEQFAEQSGDPLILRVRVVRGDRVALDEDALGWPGLHGLPALDSENGAWRGALPPALDSAVEADVLALRRWQTGRNVQNIEEDAPESAWAALDVEARDAVEHLTHKWARPILAAAIQAGDPALLPNIRLWSGPRRR